jgi:tetratricopeptide (TPR) repeat protein
MSNLTQSNIKDEQASKEVDFIPDSESVLVALGIDSVALKSTKMPRWKRTHYRAAINWLTKYKPQSEAPNLEKVRGYLEAFHHLCELEAWEAADKILFIRVTTPTTEELHKQLDTWGYYRERAELYIKILNKLSPSLNWIFAHSLGNTYYSIGEQAEAIKYYRLALAIAQEIQNRQLEIASLEGLGIVYHYALGNYDQAIKCHQQSLIVAREISERLGELTALSNTASAYYSLGNYAKAIDYYQNTLAIAREIQQPLWEVGALGSLGNVYRSLGDYAKAIDYQLQSLVLEFRLGKIGSALAKG